MTSVIIQQRKLTSRECVEYEKIKEGEQERMNHYIKYGKKYQQSIKGKLASKRYKQSVKGKACEKRYHQSPRGKLTLRRCQQKYNQSPKGRLAQKRANDKLRRTRP